MQSPSPDQHEDMVSAADAVMDELFGAVEQSLHIQKLPNPPQSHQVHLEDLGLDDIDVMWLSPYTASAQGGATPTVPPPADPNSPPEPDGNWLTPVLIMCACGSAMLATILWSIHLSQKLHQMQAVQAPAPAPVSTPAPQESAFSKEVRELLATNTPPHLPPASPVTPTLPSAPLTNTPLPVPQTVYVPVYQAPTAPVTALPPANPTPEETPPAPTPAPAYTLVGVLSLGDRSSAMFELNGSVQSIRPGKPVGDTGWTLEKVQQRDVVLRRGKETKTVVVGQKF